MGLFSALFGNSQGEGVELARNLAIGRLGYIPNDQITSDQLDSLYERIRVMTEAEVMTLPEASIVTIIRTYSDFIHKRVAHAQALINIENHRSQIGSRDVDIRRMNLDDYVAYRLSVELPNGPQPGMDDCWFNRCMKYSCEQFKLPWHGGPTEPTSITRRPKGP
jgi:hypothetical protein